MARNEKPLTLRDYQALAAIRRGMRQFLEFSASAAERAGLTPAQHQALLAIKAMSHPVTMGNLAGWLGIKPHSAVGLVNRLMRLKLIVRARSAADRRQVHLTLTPRAEEKLARLSHVHRAELRKFSSLLAPLLRRLG